MNLQGLQNIGFGDNALYLVAGDDEEHGLFVLTEQQARGFRDVAIGGNGEDAGVDEFSDGGGAPVFGRDANDGPEGDRSQQLLVFEDRKGHVA